MKTSAYLKRLRTNEQAHEALKNLCERGFSKAWCKGLLEHVAALPQQWDTLNNNHSETKPETKARRQSLARKMRRLAADIADDTDGHEYVVRTITEWVKVSDILVDTADNIESEFLPPALSRRINRPGFCLDGTFFWIEHYRTAAKGLGKKVGRRALNHETEMLVSALLDVEIPRGTMTQRRKAVRKPYESEH